MTTWAVWFVAAMILFACIEGFALFTRRIPTLSATIWQLTRRQPLLPFAFGLVIGALAVHFWVGAIMKYVIECEGIIYGPPSRPIARRPIGR